MKYATIGGNTWISLADNYDGDREESSPTNCTGSIDLSHCRVGADLELTGIWATSPTGPKAEALTSIVADDIEVRGDLVVSEVRDADVSLWAARVSAGIRLKIDASGPRQLVLSHGHANGTLTIRASEDAQARIDLTGFRCAGLDDDRGRGWRGLTSVTIDGFEYGRIVQPSSAEQERAEGSVDQTDSSTELSNRLHWLGSQYQSHKPSRDTIRIQPYEHLAQIWRAEGRFELADHVTFERLQLERRLLNGWALRWIKFWSLELPFRYGLSVLRASLTFALFIIIGWLSAEVGNYGSIRLLPLGTDPQGLMFSSEVNVPLDPVLMIDTATVSTFAFAPASDVAVGAPSEGPQSLPPAPPTPPRPVTRLADASGIYQTEITCGDQIETLLYAFDVFVPLLDLRQESKCAISGQPGAWAWRLGKGLYATLGWFVTSGFVLTASGLLRRQVEH